MYSSEKYFELALKNVFQRFSDQNGNLTKEDKETLKAVKRMCKRLLKASKHAEKNADLIKAIKKMLSEEGA